MLKFDASYYLNKYPDVAAAVAAGQTTAEAHFNNFGQLEGRIPNAYFNPVEYVQLYADLASQGKGFNAWAHYVTFGANEGRIPSAQFANFDATKYLASNSDLTAAGLKTDAQALDHYLTYGVKEGRVAYNKDGSVLTLTNVNSSTSLTAELTVNTDVATANVFNAGLAYTPGGNDRVNALQDEDILTGIGTNPTLNATLGNANDNGAIIITPKLVNVQTVNVDFTGSGGAVQALDLQDTTGLKTVNINRVTQASNTARIENIKQVIDTMSIARTNANEAGVVEFSFGTGTLAGSNTASLKLSDVQVGMVNIGGNSSTVTTAGVSTTGYENLTINSGSVANSIGTLNLPMDTGVTGKVTITGDKDLTLASKSSVINGATTTVESTNYAGGIAQASGRLASIDASAFTGNLTLNIGNGIYTTGQADTSGTLQNVTITGGKGNDKFILQDTIEAGDSLTGGDGTDTLLIVNGGNVNSSSSSVTKIEQVEVRLNTTSTATVDFDKLPDLNTGTGVTSVTVRNESNTNVAAPANSAPTAGTTTFNLNNLSAGQGVAVKIEHSDTSSNGLTQSVINANLKSASGASDTVGITIAEGLNNDARFNFTLAAGGTTSATQVENVTLTDTDSESNTVLLSNVAQHTGTITIDKPTTITKSVGQFINLDVAAAATNASLVGGYGIEVNGSPLTAGAAKDFQTTITTGDSAVNASTVTSSTIYRTLNNGAAGETRIIAQTFNASTETADVIARFGDVTRSDGVSSMSIKTGSGNDTLIFDAQNVKNSGYTSGDTVAAGTGLDTLVIDGNNNGTVAGRIDVQKSEWDNTTGVDVLRLAGNQAVVNANTTKDSGGFLKATSGGYYVEIDNEFVKQTDAGNNLVIINNDGNLATNLESDLVLNVRALAQTSNVNFIGANSNGADATLTISANRIQAEDNSANANNKFDGGDSNINNTTTTTVVAIGNNNVFEVFNTSDVSINDLSNTKNFNRIEATNDVSVVQTMKLVLNDTVMDQLVDSNHTAANSTVNGQSQIERLQVVANDNAIVNGAYQQVSVDASAVTNKFALDILTGRGTDTVIGTAGNDNIVMLGNYTTGTYTAADTTTNFDINVKANLAAGAAVTQLVATDSINGGAGTDKLITYGAIDLTGATLTSIESIEAHSDVRLTVAQFNQLIANRVALNANDTSAVISFVGTGTHALTVVNNDGTTTNVDLGRVNLTSGSGSLTVNTVAGTATGAVAPTTSGSATDSSTVGAVTVNGTEVSSTTNVTSGTSTPTTPTTPTTGTTVAVAAANTTAYDASAANVTFNVASGNYTYNINGFGSGDKLAFATGQALSITNNSGTDGVIDITGTANGQLVTIHLTGVSAAQDGAVFSVDSFNTAFGSGSLA